MPEAGVLKKAREKSYRLLAYRPRTEYELRCGLEKAGFVPEIIDEVIAELKEKNLLDDMEFAKNLFARRIAGKPVGARLLRAELKQKGVSSEIISTVLQNYGEDDEFSAAMRLVNIKTAAVNGQINWRRLAGFLSRRGFSSAILNKVYRWLEEDGRFDIS